ncbi:uncharacterized protein LOC107414384 [Ziziphus jujuba]|uniref:Uncharacterized protein LOC107414384 n=1 Tax=Ziziphus jujuba TaxID=326968 RepID=A0A6P3ZWS1_ZIZJJ|nr:uncharacterized protein LOC107414384 [Ziziphus jujuba]
MGDNKGDTSKKQQTQQQQQQISSSPKDPLDESTETRPIILHQQQQQPPPPPPAVVVVTGAPAFYVPSGATSSSPFEQQQFESVNPKRPRYTTTTGQWKLLPSPSSQQKQTPTQITSIHTTEQSSPSPTANPTNNPPPTTTTTAQPQHLLHSTAASSSDTASSPSHSPLPSLSAASGQDTNKSEGENPVHHHHQFRKGKYVSPVWKPNEMLWLARAWRIQYQGSVGSGDGSGSSSLRTEHHHTDLGTQTRSKTRAEKDKEVAEFLQRQGINRDAKTAGTKWDNMLGEFRKVYEWERGGEREQVGKSYFRLSPYERKLHRLPASFDEEVFEELSQFMGSRMRSTPQGRGGSAIVEAARILPAPPSFKDDELHLSASAGRTKQLMMSSSGGEPSYHGGRPSSLLGFESSSMDVGGPSPLLSSSKELRRIGKIRMIWEESVSLWGEEGEHHRGRVRLQGSSFLNADELTYFDDGMVACTMEAFEDGPLRGFSVDRFVSGQQVKVFGRRKSSFYSAATTSSGFSEKIQLPLTEPSIIRSFPPWEFQDPTEYYVGCLRVPPQSLPSLFELSWYLQEPPSEELRFPLRKDVYRDLPQGKDLFLTTSSEMLDCRSITYDILSPIIRINPSITTSTATSRDSFIGLWDDCINRIVSKFCSVEMVTIRKPTSTSPSEPLQDQWPNVTGFVRNFCLWRGEEVDQLREGHVDPSSSLVEKLLWTYVDLPYILGYYAVGYVVTFCALSRIQDRIIRTDLHTVDLSSPSERIKALVPCYRIAGLLPLLADRCLNNINNNGGGGGGGSSSFKMLPYSDFERIDAGSGEVIEMTPNTVTRYFSNRRKWTAVKEIYDFLDHRIPHAEFIHRSSEKDLALVFKPRGCKFKPSNFDQLVEALKYVTKALVALHDLSFMHRDLSWDKVMRRCDRENEWFVCGFDEAVSAPQIYPSHPMMMGMGGDGETEATMARGRRAPEMERGLHGVKVDVWGVGHLVRSCGLAGMPKMLRELQKRCLDQNPEQRPTAADCYHHLLQLQSSLSVSSAAGVLI